MRRQTYTSTANRRRRATPDTLAWAVAELGRLPGAAPATRLRSVLARVGYHPTAVAAAIPALGRRLDAGSPEAATPLERFEAADARLWAALAAHGHWTAAHPTVVHLDTLVRPALDAPWAGDHRLTAHALQAWLATPAPISARDLERTLDLLDHSSRVRTHAPLLWAAVAGHASFTGALALRLLYREPHTAAQVLGRLPRARRTHPDVLDVLDALLPETPEETMPSHVRAGVDALVFPLIPHLGDPWISRAIMRLATEPSVWATAALERYVLPRAPRLSAAQLRPLLHHPERAVRLLGVRLLGTRRPPVVPAPPPAGIEAARPGPPPPAPVVPVRPRGSYR